MQRNYQIFWIILEEKLGMCLEKNMFPNYIFCSFLKHIIFFYIIKNYKFENKFLSLTFIGELLTLKSSHKIIITIFFLNDE